MSGSLQPVSLATLFPTTRAGVATVFGSNGSLQDVAADLPRLDHAPNTGAVAGVLIEGSRRNDIRNPRCEGAVAGTPGTNPTNWVTFGAHGISFNVVGSGVEAGIPYVDLRLSGTATQATTRRVRADQTYPTAAQNEVWTHSAYVRLVAGTMTGITNTLMYVTEWTAANVFVTEAFNTHTVSTGALGTGRISHTRTLTDATTGRAGAQIGFEIANAAVVDATFRIGAPQLELGGFASSVILPAVGTPAVTTRALDSVVRALTPSEWDGVGAFFVAEGIVDTQAAFNRHLFAFDDDTANNAIAIRVPANASTAELVVVNAGVTTTTALGSITLGQPFRVAVRCVGGAFNAALNGGATQTSTAAFPAGIFRARLGRRGPTGSLLFGHVRLLVLDRGLRPGANLQALSTVGASYL